MKRYLTAIGTWATIVKYRFRKKKKRCPSKIVAFGAGHKSRSMIVVEVFSNEQTSEALWPKSLYFTGEC